MACPTSPLLKGLQMLPTSKSDSAVKPFPYEAATVLPFWMIMHPYGWLPTVAMSQRERFPNSSWVRLAFVGLSSPGDEWS